MNPFDRAWSLLKDFTTDKLLVNPNVGGFKTDTRPYGPFSSRNQKRWDGKDTDIFYFQGEPYRKGSSRAKPTRNNMNQMIVANLPVLRRYVERNDFNKPLGERKKMLSPQREDELIAQIIQTLSHEHGHGVSDPEVDEAMWVKGKGALNEIPTKEKRRAKEYGAYVMQGAEHDEIQEHLKRRNLL